MLPGTMLSAQENAPGRIPVYTVPYEFPTVDGVKEVLSETNGAWNRVSVWDAAGRPKYDASCGPGRRSSSQTMRDLDVDDLGDPIPVEASALS